MQVDSIHVHRTSTILEPDLSRVLLRPFMPGDSQRVLRIIQRIMSLGEEQVGPLLEEISRRVLRTAPEYSKPFSGTL